MMFSFFDELGTTCAAALRNGRAKPVDRSCVRNARLAIGKTLRLNPILVVTRSKARLQPGFSDAHPPSKSLADRRHREPRRALKDRLADGSARTDAVGSRTCGAAIKFGPRLALLASIRDMSRNLYILGATLFFFAVVSFAMTFTTGPYQIGLPGNGSLWKTIALFLLVLSLPLGAGRGDDPHV